MIMLCETVVQRRICYLPGYTVLCPVILQENGNSFERGTDNDRNNQNVEKRITPVESKRRWKCPTCKYNSNAHYFDGEERAAGLSTAEQRQDLGFSNQSYRQRQKEKTSKNNDRRQGKNSNSSGRSKTEENNYSYNAHWKENSKGYNPYCPDSCNERENNCFRQYGKEGLAEASPYLLKICLVPSTPMPKKKQRDQNRRKNKDSEKKNSKARNSSQIQHKGSNKMNNACYRIFINCEADPSTECNRKSDSNDDCCDCERIENVSPCCLFNPEKAKIIPKFVGFLSGWSLFVDESFD